MNFNLNDQVTTQSVPPRTDKTSVTNAHCFLLFSMDTDYLVESIKSITQTYGIKKGREVLLNSGLMLRDQPWWDDEVRKPVEMFFQTNGISRFPSRLDYAKGKKVFVFLKNHGFIAASTKESDFLYLMGCSNERPIGVKPIEWLKTKQLLREMLELWCLPMIRSDEMKKSKIEVLCPMVFIIKGKKAQLAKNKPYMSKETDELKNFFSTL